MKFLILALTAMLLLAGSASALLDPDTAINWTKTINHNISLASGYGVTGVKVGDIIDTSYGLKNSTSNKAQVNITADDGLEFGTGATAGSLGVEAGDGIDTSSSGVSVDVTDVIDTAYGLTENTNNVRINLTANKGLEFGTGASLGGLQVKLNGYSLAMGASGIKVNDSDLIEVSGITASGASYLNATTIGSGDTLAVTDADKITSGGIIVPENITISIPLSNQTANGTAFTAINDNYKIVAASEVHSVAATTGGATTLTLVKVTGTQAPATAGVVVQSAGFNLKGAPETVQLATMAGANNCKVNSTDRLGIRLNNPPTALAGGCLNIVLQRVP